MHQLHAVAIGCPFCGEIIDILVDNSVPYQEYTEDCQVCCQPILLSVAITTDGDINIDARQENE